MNTFQKTVKKAIEKSAIAPDRVIYKKNGTVELRHGFFYRHGKTSDLWRDGVVNCLLRAGVTVKAIVSEEVWQAWPKDSYWTVTIGAVENGQEKS